MRNRADLAREGARSRLRCGHHRPKKRKNTARASAASANTEEPSAALEVPVGDYIVGAGGLTPPRAVGEHCVRVQYFTPIRWRSTKLGFSRFLALCLREGALLFVIVTCGSSRYRVYHACCRFGHWVPAASTPKALGACSRSGPPGARGGASSRAQA